MPRKLNGRKLTDKEHRMWKKAFEAAKASGADSPGAVATSAVQKHRRKRKSSIGRALMKM